METGEGADGLAIIGWIYDAREKQLFVDSWGGISGHDSVADEGDFGTGLEHALMGNDGAPSVGGRGSPRSIPLASNWIGNDGRHRLQFPMTWCRVVIPQNQGPRGVTLRFGEHRG